MVAAGERRGRARGGPRLSPTAALPGHLRRSEDWHGLRPGDLVEIAGAGRGATWRFRAHVRNERNGTESVEVMGGAAGREGLRSFPPDQVFPVGARHSGAPSLEVAPQLPLG